MPSFLELSIERAVAGGRMLARHDGQIVFVHGAIPGERVRARIERRQKQVLFADTVDVLEASPDRREPACDLACGGSSYAHIQYGRQRALKAEIIRDAFARIAKHALDAVPDVAASPEYGYRMRTRLHLAGGKIGFFREGTHTLCDAGATGQLRADTIAAAADLCQQHAAAIGRAQTITVSENVPATERAFYFESADGEIPLPGLPASIADTAETIWPGGAPVPAGTRWRRRASSFFQGNRYLLGALVSNVIARASGAERVADLYAGGGLFSIALASLGARVTAVESDPSGAADLLDNSEPYDGRVVPLAIPVEVALERSLAGRPDLVILDPPRTGASDAAMAGIVSRRAPRIIYVSCDAPTLARDSARLIAAGYRLDTLDAFDMFPNTPHVEMAVTFSGGA